jgi:3,4-dihydroxy 2-butanone 4-phosphate synthase/GTP cyclohydrolase II
MNLNSQRIDMNESSISSPEEIIAEIKAGRMVVMVDDENRENEGDLVIAADHITPQMINFMAMYGRGLICMPLEGAIIDRLNLPQMAQNNTAKYGTAFTVSIGAREGVTTGISAFDRAHTVKVAVNPQSKPDDLSTPGHIFPLRACDGGVMARNGHTEASVDLAKLAGCTGAAVICEVMNDDGTMARLADLEIFAAKHDMKIGTIADLVTYRSNNK